MSCFEAPLGRLFTDARGGARTFCALRWDQVDFEHGLLHVRRIKNGMPSVHPLGGGELRALRKLQREACRPGMCSPPSAARRCRRPAFARCSPARGRPDVSVPGPPAHAAACVRLQARQRRPGHARAAALSRPQEHPAHGALHRARGRSLQVRLGRLTAWARPLLPLAGSGPVSCAGWHCRAKVDLWLLHFRPLRRSTPPPKTQRSRSWSTAPQAEAGIRPNGGE